MECDEASIEQEGNKEEIHEKTDESSSSSCAEQADVEEILENSYTSSPSGSLEEADDKEEELDNADKYSSSGSPEPSEEREEVLENDDSYSSCGSLEQSYDKEEILESEDESIFNGGPKTSYDKENVHEKADESSSSSSPKQAGVEERTVRADKCSSSGNPEQVDEKEKILKDDDKYSSICSPDQSYYKKEIFENISRYSSASSPEQSYNKEEMHENIDNYYFSSSPEQSYDREEMLEYADKYSSSSSLEQSYDKEEMLENADKSFSSGSPEQTDDKDEIHENANSCFSGSSPEQLDDVDEMLDNVDNYFSSGSPEQADDKEDILENASKYSSCGNLEQADDKEEILENVDKHSFIGIPEKANDKVGMHVNADKNSFSGNPKHANNKEEMFKSANKSISNGSTKQSDCNLEMLAKPNNASSSDSQKQVDDNEELLEYAVKSFSGSPEQKNFIEEMIKNSDKSSPCGSPRQTDNMEEVHENVDSSSFSVDLEKLTHHVNELDETSMIRSAQENIYRSSLFQKNTSSTDEHKIIHNESRLSVGTTSPNILQRHAVCSDKDENMREVNANSCSSTVDSLVKTEDQVTDESVTECLQSVDTANRLLKTDKEIFAFNFVPENRQNAAPSTTNSVQDSPGSYCVIDQENRQIIGIDDFSDGLESSLGTVKKQVVNNSVSENRQVVDTTTADGCSKELMNGGVVTEVVLESREDVDVSSCDVNDYADSPVIDVAHIKLPVSDSKEDNSTTFSSASENLNTIKTQVDRLPLLASKEEHNPFDIQRSVPNTHGENDSKIGKLENSECVQKLKKKYKKKPCAMTRGTQTAIQLLDSSEFRDYPLDLATMQVEVGFMSVDDLQDLDPSLDDWPVLLVSQLRLRDTIINTLNAKLLDLLSKGRRLEEDVDYLKLKIWDLKQQVKKKSQNKKEQCSQTTDEDFANAWKKWYCGTWHQYYGESDPSSVHYWPGHYSQHTTVSSLSQLKPTGDNEDSNIGIDGTILIEDETQDNTEKTDEKEGESGQISVDTQNCPHRTAESDIQEQSFNSKVDSIEQDKQVLKRNILNQHERCKSQKDSESYDGGLIKKDKDNREYETNTSSINISHRLTESGEINEKILTKSSELEKLDIDKKVRHGHENFRQENQDTSDKSNIAGVDCRWDASGVSITTQVKAVAAEAVQNTGYVFQEELGLYYDYTSGYYYDAENGLYYDSKTGTYFYYDHASQAYQFHSQVSVKKERKRRLEKDDDDKGTQQEKKKRLPKVKAVHVADREEGECTDTDEEVQERDELVVDNEEEVVSELDEEDEISEEEAAVHVPPSLRLMVVESESDKVKVGTLHLITLDGGTVGRESRNVVQLLDLSISKVHAAITYHSNGPEDHHYFVKDLGSNNGTFVNGARLSEPRETSQEVEIGHGWMLQFGSVTLKCHVHPGRLTCNECEPGLVISSLTSHGKSEAGRSPTSFKDAKSREKARKKQLKALRKKYAVTSRDEVPVTDGEYNDRALRRLKEVGSDNPYEKTEVASADTALKENNKGYTLLQKMGWSEGQGLGKSHTGITEPIQPEIAVGHGGLGCTHLIAPPEPAQDRRRKHLQITQERYKQTSSNH